MSSFRVRNPRAFAQLTAALFLISSAFPVAASLIPSAQRPAWQGIADVTAAFALALGAISIDYLFRSQVDTDIKLRSYAIIRALTIVLVLLMVLYFTAGEQIDWEVLLVGLAWRSWMFIFALPSWLAAWQIKARA